MDSAQHALQLVVLHWAPALEWRMQHGSLLTQQITGTLWGLLGASGIRLLWCVGQVQSIHVHSVTKKVDSGFARANHMWSLSRLLLKLRMI